MDLMNLTASINLDSSGFETGLNQASANFDSFAEKVGGLLGGGGAIAGVALNLGNIISMVKDFAGSVLTTGMNFDKEMSAVQAVLGATEGTEENMLRLRQFGLSVAQDSVFTAEETAQAYYYMGMAGWKTEQMLAGLPGIINLAAASGEDLGQVSDIVTDSLTAFGLGAGQAAHYADVLAQTATNSNTDVSRMGQTFKYVAPVAGSMGYAVEDVAVSIGLLANAGIKGSQAGTSLRNIMSRIAIDGGATEKKLGALGIITKELGVQFYDANGKARPWLEFLKDVRGAWHDLDSAKASKITDAFGDITMGADDADAVMNEFKTDLQTWRTGWNSLTSDVERENFVKNIGPQFEALGISMRDSKGRLREFNDVAHEAEIILGGLTDEQSQYYGKQIGSLRAVSAWLQLMNATDDEFTKLEKSIDNASGAAQTMAEVRLDNLWGDITMFNSALDIMKVRIFDNIKGPLRELVQFGTGAIKEISDAIEEDGLDGGIKKLGEKIQAFGEKFAPAFEALGTMLAPVVESMLTNVLGPGMELAVDLGSKLGTGIMQGIVSAASKSDNPFIQQLLKWIGIEGSFGETGLAGWAYDSGIETPENMSGKAIEFGDGTAVPVDIIPNLTIDSIDSAIEKANGGPIQLELDDGSKIELSGDAAQKLKRMVAEGFELDELLGESGPTIAEQFGGVIKDGIVQGGEDGWSSTLDSYRKYAQENASRIWAETFGTGDTGTTGKKGKKKTAEQEAAEAVATSATGAKVSGTSITFDDVTVSPSAVSTAINEAIQAAGQSGSSSIQLNGQDITISDAYTIRDKLVEGAAGAGAQIASDISGDVDAVDTSGLSSKLGSAGQPAGSRIASAIQSTLSGKTYTINVKANVTGLPSGGTGGEKNARAMNVGRIFNRPTMFGYANGKAQIAGDAGPEAVIGTNSLSRMIRDAVGSAMRTNAQPQPSKPDNYQIVLDSGVLVGELTPGIDNELAFIQSWRGGGRT